jgi:hypothetical protein
MNLQPRRGWIPASKWVNDDWKASSHELPEYLAPSNRPELTSNLSAIAQYSVLTDTLALCPSYPGNGQ